MKLAIHVEVEDHNRQKCFLLHVQDEHLAHHITRKPGHDIYLIDLEKLYSFIFALQKQGIARTDISVTRKKKTPQHTNQALLRHINAIIDALWSMQDFYMLGRFASEPGERDFRIIVDSLLLNLTKTQEELRAQQSSSEKTLL